MERSSHHRVNPVTGDRVTDGAEPGRRRRSRWCPGAVGYIEARQVQSLLSQLLDDLLALGGGHVGQAADLDVGVAENSGRSWRTGPLPLTPRYLRVGLGEGLVPDPRNLVRRWLNGFSAVMSASKSDLPPWVATEICSSALPGQSSHSRRSHALDAVALRRRNVVPVSATLPPQQCGAHVDALLLARHRLRACHRPGLPPAGLPPAGPAG